MDVDAGTLLDTVTPLDAGTLRGTEAVAQRRGQDGLSPSVDVMATRRTDGEELELDIHRRFLESVMAKGGGTATSVPVTYNLSHTAANQPNHPRGPPFLLFRCKEQGSVRNSARPLKEESGNEPNS